MVVTEALMEKQTIFWVSNNDLTIFASAYSKGPAMMDNTKICADLDHMKQTIFRVSIQKGWQKELVF